MGKNGQANTPEALKFSPVTTPSRSLIVPNGLSPAPGQPVQVNLGKLFAQVLMKEPPTYEFHPRGLVNAQNSCFLNSVFQVNAGSCVNLFRFRVLTDQSLEKA